VSGQVTGSAEAATRPLTVPGLEHRKVPHQPLGRPLDVTAESFRLVVSHRGGTLGQLLSAARRAARAARRVASSCFGSTL